MMMKTLPLFGLVAGLLSPTVVSLAHVPLESSPSLQPQMQISLEFPPAPSGEGAQSSAGGGTRGNDEEDKICTKGEIPLTALIPDEIEAEITVSANPDLFVFVPENTAKQGQFIMVDEDGNEVYLNTFDLPNEAGIVQVSLPDTVTLEVGQTYTWQFVVLCNASDPGKVEFVEGKIKRTELSEDLKTQIEAATEPLEQAKLYAQERIWQDTLMILAQLRQSHRTEWEQFLKSVGLDAVIASVPLTPCCVEAEEEQEEPTPTEPDEQ
ncbi:DUF928 domain-containing protein [Lyngbya sp. PCC 8106]|uniref:DUF928 domain-containing protein n=1 Tax=Lyngbya sp. (strain PCC 8106) TaxID=313612 RepID=UPI0000EAA531|nr:DUF928 domain-containing protein [Lyngbya sp. PCC 8106]EAW35375.1 hypothetical protein L8106_20865 [Lyngbya sp. PCC 8106]